MRIGVKEPVDEHHLEIQLHDGAHHATRIKWRVAGARAHLIDAHPFHVFEPEDPTRHE